MSWKVSFVISGLSLKIVPDYVPTSPFLLRAKSKINKWHCSWWGFIFICLQRLPCFSILYLLTFLLKSVGLVFSGNQFLGFLTCLSKHIYSRITIQYLKFLNEFKLYQLISLITISYYDPVLGMVSWRFLSVNFLLKISITPIISPWY